jgi:hypothetical protein
MNASSESRVGTETNCAAVACDALGIAGVTLNDGPVTWGQIADALSRHCHLVPVAFPPDTTVGDFWLRHTVGKYLMVYSNPKRPDGSDGAHHISTLVDGKIHNTTPLLLSQFLRWADQVLEPQKV